jgi:hypothetical protein
MIFAARRFENSLALFFIFSISLGWENKYFILSKKNPGVKFTSSITIVAPFWEKA